MKILYLWEKDINNNINKCKFLIEEYIKNKGKLKNYNSFNYDDINYSINKTIIRQYSEWEKKDLDDIIDIKLKEDRQGRLRDPNKWIAYKCEICGQELTQLKSVYCINKNHTCSDECRHILKRISLVKKCDCCDKEILIEGRKIYNKYFFCDDKCKNNFYKSLPKKVVIGNCEFCGVEYKKRESDYKNSKNHFCSVECLNKAKVNKTIVKCSNCGKGIKKTKSEIKKITTGEYFCSDECKKIFKMNNKNMDKISIFKCEVCGKDSEQKKSAYDKSNHHFCSDECSGKFKSKQVIFNCENCNKEKSMKLSKYSQSQHHYCCYQCSVEGKKKQKEELNAAI